MTEPEDEDVDSGWDAGDDDEEAAPMTRAVDSARLLADAGLAALPPAADKHDEAPVTPRAESLPPIEAAPISEQPATRRASDDELARVRDRSKPPAGAPLRLGGRKHTPLVTDAAVRARTLDASAEARRPTPSTVPPVGAALRFPADGTRALREAHRRPTVINKAVREQDPLAQTVEAPATLPAELVKGRGARKESAPLVELEIPDAFDLLLEGDAKEAKPPAAAATLSFDDLDDVGASSRRLPTSLTSKATEPAIPKAVKAAADRAPATAPPPAPAAPAARANAERSKVTARGIDRKALAAELAARRQATLDASAPKAVLAPPAAAKPVPATSPSRSPAPPAVSSAKPAVPSAPPAKSAAPVASAPIAGPSRADAGAAPGKLAVPRLGGASAGAPPGKLARPAPPIAPPPTPSAPPAQTLSDDFDLGPIDPAPPRKSLPPAGSTLASRIGLALDDLPPPSAPPVSDPPPPPVSEEPDMVASARVAMESLDSLEMATAEPAHVDVEVEVEVDEGALSEEEREALLLSESEEGGESVDIEVEEPAEDPELEPIRKRFEKGDYMGALLRAESALEARPDFEAAQRYAESARELLKQLYLEKLGSGEQVLRLAMAPDEIQGLTLDHRSGFLISFIDGTATVDEILDMSGMPQLDALRLLYEMREQGVVAVDSMASP